MFIDRIQTQEEISLLIANVFGDKTKINFDDYVQINQEVTSEMFLSILSLLQTNLPCSVNFYRYKNNYEKYIGDEDDGGKTQGVVKSIASPKLMSKLSPLVALNAANQINVNPLSQKGLLKYAAANKKSYGPASADSDDSDDQDYSKFVSKANSKAEKQRRLKELEELKSQGMDMIKDGGAIRLPNRVAKGMSIDPNSGTAI